MSSSVSKMAMRNPAKRQLVTSDTSFLEKAEHDAPEMYNLHTESHPSSNLPSFPSSGLGNCLPITPPNQKIPANTSPCKLATPNSSNIQGFTAVNTSEMSSSLSGPVGFNKQLMASKMRLKNKSIVKKS